MDPNNVMMLWYVAYVDKLASRAGETPPLVDTSTRRRPMRRQLARWCGHAALRVGAWLLAEESRVGMERVDASRQQATAI